MYNSTISPKYGKCVDCPDDHPEVPVTAGRCHFHYPIYRKKVSYQKQKVRNQVRSLSNLEINQELILKNREKLDWFLMQREKMTGTCENCGGKSPKKDMKYWRWGVCHILPKEHFPSVATNDLAWWEGCITCHTEYDRNWLTAVKMPIFPELKRRFELFKHLIVSREEQKRIPECFLSPVNVENV